jgi:starch synthase (maltosyl-transferring)
MAISKLDRADQVASDFTKIARNRVFIENVIPQVDEGLYPVKRAEGDRLLIQADVFTDGHDEVRAEVLVRRKGARKWITTIMQPIGNDRFNAVLENLEVGHYEFTVRAHIDHCSTWIKAFRKRVLESDQSELIVQRAIGAEYLESIATRFKRSAKAAHRWINQLQSDEGNIYAASAELELFFNDHALADFVTEFERLIPMVVHRKRASFSAWYSFFPRSASPQPNTHGTFKDCENLLPRIKELGFDVIYFPPIHAIGQAFRKGKNNSLQVLDHEPGCPYATGLGDAGHKSILPDLGNLQDFQNLIQKSREMGMEIAMDFAIQCSPDHPYVQQFPQWFKWRPDGTVQYAENPPKKYQDVLPLDYECADWKAMWMELKSILEYWIDQGIRIFRVDNPHTKSFVFWQWCLEQIDRKYPEVIFLSEAFTRPRIMENLAKKGYHQSYTYFTWRNSKSELSQYMRELTTGPMADYFRPNFWPNTHDINPYVLQSGHEPQYIIRFVLAATLSSSYGIFGPCFELMEHAAIPGKEEYLDSEKYEIRYWDWNKRNKLMQVISLVNQARNNNPAMQSTNNYLEIFTEHDQIMAYAKVTGESRIVMVVNLDAYNKHSTMIHLPLNDIGIPNERSFSVLDLITGESYRWQGSANYVELDPNRLPFHLFKLEIS